MRSANHPSRPIPSISVASETSASTCAPVQVAADGHSVAGYASGKSRIYCLVSHSGITLAPILGRLAASEITTDQEQDLLRPFRPARFIGAPRAKTEVDQRATALGEQ
ncbi:hypothetical protein [Streptomyces sp. NPDC002779]|uniref:hypothetical protein n=1 Tax=Streptomyces sp. NPDC002779 TaxID=3364664 RepID=UPI0036CA8B41